MSNIHLFREESRKEIGRFKYIKRAGIKFKILDTKTNEYVCQTTSYPKAIICEFVIDKNVEFITPFVLNSGTYKLEKKTIKISFFFLII